MKITLPVPRSFLSDIAVRTTRTSNQIQSGIQGSVSRLRKVRKNTASAKSKQKQRTPQKPSSHVQAASADDRPMPWGMPQVWADVSFLSQTEHTLQADLFAEPSRLVQDTPLFQFLSREFLHQSRYRQRKIA